MSSIYFTEKQTIPSNLRLIIFGSITLLMGFIAVMTFTSEWDTMPQSEKPALLTLLIAPLCTLVLFIIRLDTKLTSESFDYKVYPFRKNYKVIPFGKIALIELMKPKGFNSYKGVGTHRNLNRTEMNFGGKYLIKISLINGKMISFSTNKPQELKSFLLSLSDSAVKVKIDI
ncbi:MAG: hypothetical protein PHY99_00055 [Bacteroidales bacterium]|nr:hypothetical protein [Bacteroidales bacterium]